MVLISFVPTIDAARIKPGPICRGEFLTVCGGSLMAPGGGAVKGLESRRSCDSQRITSLFVAGIQIQEHPEFAVLPDRQRRQWLAERHRVEPGIQHRPLAAGASARTVTA